MSSAPSPSVLQPYVDRPGLEGRRWWALPGRDRAPSVLVAGVCFLLGGTLLTLIVARDLPAAASRDLALNEWIRGLDPEGSLLRAVADAWSWIGSGSRTGPIVLVSAAVLLVLRQWRWAVFLLASAEVGYLISDLTKVVVGRERPPWTDFGPLAAGTSFPSGHTFGGLTAWVALGLVFCFLLPRAWSTVLAGACWSIGLLQGPSRLLVGAHWVSDVAGSLLLGGGWLLVVAGACLWRWGPSSNPAGSESSSSWYAPWDSNPEPAD